MTWRHLLFMHWPIPPEALRPLIPAALRVDTFAGAAFLGVIPFTMTIAPRGLGATPLRRSFHELNVRTYVTMDGPEGPRPGVWFFSLDAADPLSVRAARAMTKLPYYDASMTLQETGGAIAYRSRRTGPRRAGGFPGATFDATYRPTGPARLSPPGSLDAFVTERYCLYAPADHVRHDPRGAHDPGAGVQRIQIHHSPWQLAPAACVTGASTMAEPLGLTLPGEPALLHYAAEIDVATWPPERAARPGDDEAPAQAPAQGAAASG